MFKRKSLAALLALLLVACPLAAGAQALITASCFADADAATQAYYDLLEAWQASSGHTVEDYSGVVDDAWREQMVQDAAAGKLDVFFYYAAVPEAQAMLPHAVPLDEVRAAYPALNIPQSQLLREGDGKEYAVPARAFWEGLWCNKSLFDAQGLALPTDWEKMEEAVVAFRKAGIIPVAVALGDVPNYLLEVAVLSGGAPAAQRARPASLDQLPAGWIKGLQGLTRLGSLGAFDEHVVLEADAVENFLTGQAAMMVDGSWFGDVLPQQSWESTVVLPYPAYGADADPTALIGSVNMGFYISRAAWNDPARRDAAVSLFAALTAPEALAQLGFSFGGALGQSAQAMLSTAGALCPPIGDALSPDARAYWFSQAPALAAGTVDATAVWAETLQRIAVGTP
ncbi:MAG: extracellular solute-binding protein [Oscillospiraceae bacterium]|jgi:raffinose/stachyose/melibiose transport system substrate-binding protein|nr:extracellular solute-binding protein [Oscillospiraceae bacterium]